MDSLYRYSPIYSELSLNKVFDYLTIELERLSEKLFNEKLPITALKIFPHYQDEYEFLSKILQKMGPKSRFNSKTSYYIETQKNIRGYNVSLLGLRIVDPYRMQVGCGDYEIEKYDKFKEKYLDKTPFVRKLRNRDDMVEIWHPDFDVLGYVLPIE